MLLLGLLWPLHGAWAEAPTETERPRIGLVLSGGGAKGIAHVGVLRVLEEMQIPVDVVVGTSAGAAVGALYASGMPVADIEDRFIDLNWMAGFRDEPGRVDKPVRRKTQEWRFPIDPGIGISDGRLKLGRGIVQGQNLGLILNELTEHAATVRDFDTLPLRYRAVATDLHNGDAVILRDGSLADAIRISMSIPAVYTPVERQGRLLVDGGIAANLPIDVARDLGADIIIAVDISDALLRKDEMQDTLSIMGQLTTLLTRRNMNQQLASLTDQDVLITPDLEGLGSADFDQVVALMENGATAARNAAVALNSLRVSDDAWAAYRAQRERATPAPPLISGVEIANHSRFSERFLRARVRQKPGQTLDREQLEADLRRIYGLGYFETVTYSLDVQEDETAELHIRAREKSWGPNYLRFGLGYEDNFDDDTHFNLAASYQMTGLNARGGELHNSVQLGTDPRLRTELFQPVSYGHRRFLLAGLEWSKQDASLFDAGGRVAEYKVEETRADLGWGVEIGTSAEIILGVRRGRVALDRLVGTQNAPVSRVERGAWTLRAVYDTLNDPFLPEQGAFAGLSAQFERPDLGSNHHFDRVSTVLGRADTWGRNALVGRLYVSTITAGEPSIVDRVSLGGFKRLSGYSPDEISGDDAMLVSLFAYRRFGGPIVPFFAGLGYETGQAWDSLRNAQPRDLIHSGSLIAGVETFMGPVELATSYAGSDHWTVYMNVGYSIESLFDW